MTRAQARSEVNAMLDGMGVSRSVHAMQQQPRLREDMVDYYGRRAREAQAQSDAHQGEVYDNDLDRWVPAITIQEWADSLCPVCGRGALSCPSCVKAALCGPMGRVAA